MQINEEPESPLHVDENGGGFEGDITTELGFVTPYTYPESILDLPHLRTFVGSPKAR